MKTAAFAMAALALVAVGIAIARVVTRPVPPPPLPATVAIPAPVPIATPLPEFEVQAHDVAELAYVIVVKKKDGVQISDRALTDALYLQQSDTLFALAGRRIYNAMDLGSAIHDLELLSPGVVYVDIIRAGTPLTLKWKVDSDLAGADPRAPFPSQKSISDVIYRYSNGLHYYVPRAAARLLLDDTDGALFQPGGIEPVERDSLRVAQLKHITPASVWFALGLRSDDIVLAANGHALRYDTFFEDTRFLKGLDAVDLEIERDGKQVFLSYSSN